MSKTFLQTYAGSDLNQIGEKLQTYLEERELKPGMTVKYRLLNGVKNIDPQRKKGDPELFFPASIAFPLRDRILKPEGGTVEIAVVNHFDNVTKLPTFKTFIHNTEKNDNGIIFLSGDKIDDIERYPLMELSNRNKSNPYRDEKEAPVYERIDEAAEAKVRMKKRNYFKDSLNAIDSWDAEMKRRMAAAYNLSSSLDLETIKDKLEEIAEKDPQTFYKAIDSEDMGIKATIKQAKEADIIEYSAHENKWFYKGSGETIVLMDRKEGISEFDQFANFLKNGQNGSKVKAQLEKLIKAKK